MLYPEIMRAIINDHERSIEQEVRERRWLRATDEDLAEAAERQRSATVSVTSSSGTTRSACAPARPMIGSSRP